MLKMLKMLINLLLILLTIASLPHIHLTLNFAGAAPVNGVHVTSQITATNGSQHLLQLEMKKPNANETNTQQQQQQQQQQHSSFNVIQQLNPSYVKKIDGENELQNKPQQQQQSSFNTIQQLNPTYIKKIDGEHELQNKPNNKETENSRTTLQKTTFVVSSPPLTEQLNEEVTREPIADTTPANYNKSLLESNIDLEKELKLEIEAVDASTYTYKNEMYPTENYSNLKYENVGRESALESDNLSLTTDSYTFNPTDNELTTAGSALNEETTTDNPVTDIMETTAQAEGEEDGPLMLVLANFTALASLENDTEYDMESITTTTLTALDDNEKPTPLTTTEYPSNEAATTPVDDIWQNFQVTEHISKFFEEDLANEQFQGDINETNAIAIANIKPASNVETTNLPITTEIFEVSTKTITADPGRVQGKYSNDSELLETTPTTLLTTTTESVEGLEDISDNVKNFQNLEINNKNNSISLSMTHNETEDTTTDILPPTTMLTTTTDIMTTDLSVTEYPTPTKRSRPPKLVHLRNPDGVEIFYGYSIVSLNQ